MPAQPSPGTASATHWAWPWTAWDRWEREGPERRVACHPACHPACHLDSRAVPGCALSRSSWRRLLTPMAPTNPSSAWRSQAQDRLRANRLRVVQTLCQDARVDFTDKKGFVFHYKVVNRPYRRQATVLHLLSAARFKDGSAEEEACARAVLQRAVAAGVSAAWIRESP